MDEDEITTSKHPLASKANKILRTARQLNTLASHVFALPNCKTPHARTETLKVITHTKASLTKTTPPLPLDILTTLGKAHANHWAITFYPALKRAANQFEKEHRIAKQAWLDEQKRERPPL